ncbi:MAG: hypothetical protein ACTHJ1_10685 [Bordetella sp.]|uniref:hypothetical protein n=1 Tax=Bordetella sp. TaxID=28081 RepID=UPI003F7B68F0
MTRLVQPSLDAYLHAAEAGDHEGALKALFEQIDSFPHVATLHWLAGAEHAQLGSFDAAEASMIRSLNLDPGLHVARFQLGLMQYSSGRPATAMETWAALEKLDEQHYLVFFKRGFAALAIDDFDGAMLLFSRGIEKNTENATLNRDIRMIAEEIERRRRNGTPSEQSAEDATSIDYLLASYRRNQ